MVLDNFKTQMLIWDKAEQTIHDKYQANSGDSNGRKLRVQVLDGGSEVNLTGIQLHLAWRARGNRGKGLDVLTPVDITKGIFEISYTTEMLSHIGEVPASLVLIQSSGRTESSEFIIRIAKSIVDDDSVQSDNSFTALTSALVNVNQLEETYTQGFNQVNAQLAEKAKQVDLIKTNNDVALKANKTQVWSMANMGQDIKESMTGGSVAVVEKNTILTENVVNEQITRELTDFIKLHSTNLITFDNVVVGKTLSNTTGLPSVDNATYSVTDFIPVTPSTEYIATYVGRRAYFRKDKSFIKGETATNPSGAFATDSETYYMCLAISTDGYNKKTARMNIGNILREPEIHKVKIPHLVTEGDLIENLRIKSNQTDFVKLVSNNIFNKNSYTDNMSFINSNGSPTPSSGHRLSENIDAEPETTYSQKGLLKLAFYDEFDNFLGFVGGDTNFTTPKNTSYIRTVHASGNHQINKGNNLLDYDEFTVEVKGVKINRQSVLSEVEQLEKFKTETKYIIDGTVDGVYSSPVIPEEEAADLMTEELYSRYDNELVSQFPSYVTRTTPTQNTLGQGINQYEFRSTPVRDDVEDENIPKMILISGVHPEKGGALTLFNCMKQICENWKSDELLETLRWNVHFIVIPVVNPYAFDNKTRGNENGVDIARNFPTDWRQGTLGEQTYGGTHPLSEKETQYVDSIMNENKDAIFFTSFHNFYGETTNKDFIWSAAGTQMQIDLGKKLVSKMTRKWKKEHAWLPQGEDVYFGYSNYGAPIGSEGRHAVSYGIQGGTFEICETLYLEDSPKKFSSNVLTFGAETFINYLLLNLKNNVEYYNQKKS